MPCNPSVQVHQTRIYPRLLGLCHFILKMRQMVAHNLPHDNGYLSLFLAGSRVTKAIMTQEITVIVLAAGNGARFRAAGGAQGKLQSPFTTERGTYTVLAHVLHAVKTSGLAWHMVEPAHTQHLPIQGMGSSIATGVAATQNAQGWLILPADLPLIQPESLRQLASALEKHDVVVPTVQGQRGHPVGFSNICLPDLLKLQGDQGAKHITHLYDLHFVPLEDVGCILDVDTPEALSLAQQFAYRHKS